jgi:hypothetical protein
MRMHFSFGLTRKKPRVEDRRTTKKHGEQIRVFRMIRDKVPKEGVRVSCSRSERRAARAWNSTAPSRKPSQRKCSPPTDASCQNRRLAAYSRAQTIFD